MPRYSSVMPQGPDHAERVHPTLILLVLSLAGLSYAILSSAVIPALPTLEHDLHTSETGVTWLLTGFLLSASVATSIIGRLGDMYGKERLLLWTLVILAFGTLLAAVSNSLGLLIVARVIQGAGGGIFPLAFSIARDEFPRERVAGSIGLISSILGVGGGAGLVIGALILEHLNWHWLFWLPLVVTVLAAVFTWRFIPESPIRAPGRVNWLAATLMSIGICAILIAIAQTTVWGWGGWQTWALFGFGALVCVAWVAVEVHSDNPLVDMTMMRIRGVWTTNLVAFLLGAQAGRVARRYGSKLALIVGTGVTAVSFGFLWAAHGHPFEMLISAALLGVGIGLAFAALGNLIVQAVPATQTGVATGMNTVMRTLGGALGGQISATFIADHVVNGEPTVTGFNLTFAMATVFLIVCMFTAFLVPGPKAAGEGSDREEEHLARQEELVGEAAVGSVR